MYQQNIENHMITAPHQRAVGREKLAYISVAVTVAVIIALSTVVQVSGAVIASGSLTVTSQTKSISHLTGGILSEMNVKEGQRVRRGDVLLRLDTSVTETSAEVSSESVSALVARQARLEAELSGKARPVVTLDGPQANDPAARTAALREQQLFEARRAETGAQVGMLAARQSQLRAEIVGLRSRIASLRRQQALLAPELQGLRELYKQELVTINRLNEIERSNVALRGEIASLEASIVQAQARIAETAREMSVYRQTLRSSAGQELNQVVTALAEGKLRSVDADDTLQRATITAPQDGYVDSIAFATPGSAIPAGQAIMRIIPARDNLIAEAQISPSDIDQVRLGQKVRLRFSSLQGSNSPEIDGKVTFISPERIEDPRTGMPYYRIRVAAEHGELRAIGSSTLSNGMPVEAYIATDAKTFMSYLFKPLIDQIQRAFRD